MENPINTTDHATEWFKDWLTTNEQQQKAPPCQPCCPCQQTVCPCCGRPYGWQPYYPYTPYEPYKIWC